MLALLYLLNGTRQWYEFFFIPALQNFSGYDPNWTWFQQNGARTDKATASMGIIRELFPGAIISRFGDILTP